MLPYTNTDMKAISLFASSGVGDLALRANNIHVIVANELLNDRAELFTLNFPDSTMLSGDIWELKDEIIEESKKQLNGEELDFFLATPPCQGMSKNGQGKLLNGIRSGLKPKIDVRNRLVIPTMEIALALKPKIVMFENVPEMMNTVINDEDGRMITIVEYINEKLGVDYVGKAEVVEFADFGVPQSRKRLITIFSRVPELKAYFHKHGAFVPPRTHAQHPKDDQHRWVTVRQTIGDLPALDAISNDKAHSDIPYHFVPVLDPKKYEWIKNTPPEKGAFHNQCINPKCMYQGNPSHGSDRTVDGINRASMNTPIYCVKCSQLLPRPYTIIDGEKRLMKGFTSAYKRMSWDKPSPTLTTNLSYPSSDNKLHPDQNRVLSLWEAHRLHTLDRYGYIWDANPNLFGAKIKNGLIRDTIGESVPPLALDKIIASLIDVLD